MMKMNKKLLTRLFALLASLVLVFALALPCFADETGGDQQSEFVIKEVVFDDYQTLYNYLVDDFTRVQYIVLDIEGTTVVFRPTVRLFANFVIASDAISIIEEPITFTYYLWLSNNRVVLAQESENGIITTDIPIESLSSSGVLVFVLDSEETPSVETGWYAQVKNIIKDAVFGQDAVLNDSQEFTINQISLWLTLIVILLPFIIVAIILVRCFR